MPLNLNVDRIAAASDLEDATQYGIQRSSEDRLKMVDDPTGQRGQVVKATLVSGDPLVSGSHRSELVRDILGGDYALRTGGGFYWFSYMLDPMWLQQYQLLEASVPAITDYSILIQQFHGRNSDASVHPKWWIAVSEYGVTLNKSNQSDAAGDYERVAAWDVDSLVWHDVVAQVIWSDTDGLFALYLDDKLIYRFVGPTIYVGATLGGYFKQGIYAPGKLPSGMTEVSLYMQGFRQAFPPGPYSLCRGVEPKYVRGSDTGRSKTARTVATRTLTTRTTADT